MIIKNNQDEILNYLTDASNFQGECDTLYIPENEEELILLVKSLYQSNIKFTISGAGTGLTGGRVPKGGVVISTEKLNKIIEINLQENYAIVQAGVYLSKFLSELKSIGYFYPPDPTEKNCFIGGTIANNASGAKTFKYGSTRNFVLGLKIILPDGDTLQLKRGNNFASDYNLNIKTDSDKEIQIEIPQINLPTTKNAAGYYLQPNMDAIDLFIGSEGTLGIISTAKLKIFPLPEKIISAVCFFENEIDAIKFIDEARDLSYRTRREKLINEIDALALEFFDKYSLRFLQEDFPKISPSANGAVWFEQEANSSNEEILIEQWIKLIFKHNSSDEFVWFATNENERKEIEEFRQAISWKVNEHISKKNLRKLGTDVAVPDCEMIGFYDFLINKMKVLNLNYVLYGHLGNSHFHLNILPKDEYEYSEGKKIYKEICDKAIQLKGTISAEHGIGKIKKEYLIDMFGVNNVNKMKEIKFKFDPQNLLNRGNIFLDDD